MAPSLIVCMMNVQNTMPAQTKGRCFSIGELNRYALSTPMTKIWIDMLMVSQDRPQRRTAIALLYILPREQQAEAPCPATFVNIRNRLCEL